VSSSAELPFVAAPAGDLAGVTETAERAAQRYGLPTPELIRLSMNGVFAAGENTVLKVGRTTVAPDAVTTLVELLTNVGVRVPAVVAEPLVIGEFSVIPLERIHPSGTVDWERVGEMVATVHRLDADRVAAIYPLPWCAIFPWWQLRMMLCQAGPHLDHEAMLGLLAAVDRHLPLLDQAANGQRVVAHGDVHPGNVVPTVDGPVLLDWDLLCTAPVGWDHAPLMRHASVWGGEAVYDAFAAGYGRSFSADPLAEAIAELRLVAATLMRVEAATTNPAAAEEANHRLTYWRHGRIDTPWNAQ